MARKKNPAIDDFGWRHVSILDRLMVRRGNKESAELSDRNLKVVQDLAEEGLIDAKVKGKRRLSAEHKYMESWEDGYYVRDADMKLTPKGMDFYKRHRLDIRRKGMTDKVMARLAGKTPKAKKNPDKSKRAESIRASARFAKYNKAEKKLALELEREGHGKAMIHTMVLLSRGKLPTRGVRLNPEPSIRLGSMVNGWKLVDKNPVKLQIAPLDDPFDYVAKTVYTLVVVDPISGEGRARIYALYDEKGKFTGQRVVRPRTDWKRQLDSATRWANHEIGIRHEYKDVPRTKPRRPHRPVQPPRTKSKLPTRKRKGYTITVEEIGAGEFEYVATHPKYMTLEMGPYTSQSKAFGAANRAIDKAQGLRLTRELLDNPGKGKAPKNNPRSAPTGQDKEVWAAADALIHDVETQKYQAKMAAALKRYKQQGSPNADVVVRKFTLHVLSNSKYSLKESAKRARGPGTKEAKVILKMVTDGIAKGESRAVLDKYGTTAWKLHSKTPKEHRGSIAWDITAGAKAAATSYVYGYTEVGGELLDLIIAGDNASVKAGHPFPIALIDYTNALARFMREAERKGGRLRVVGNPKKAARKKTPKKNPHSEIPKNVGIWKLIEDSDGYLRYRSSWEIPGFELAIHLSPADKGPPIFDLMYIPSPGRGGRMLKSKTWRTVSPKSNTQAVEAAAKWGARLARKEVSGSAVLNPTKKNPGWELVQEDGRIQFWKNELPGLWPQSDTIYIVGPEPGTKDDWTVFLGPKLSSPQITVTGFETARRLAEEGQGDKTIRWRKNPPKKKVAKKKATKKKATKKKATKKKAARKTPPYQLLINRCRKLWDHYCERPSKKRLKEVLEHLEEMKASTSKKVKEERSACLRIANKEARRLGMK
jgi:hypothetical protein